MFSHIIIGPGFPPFNPFPFDKYIKTLIDLLHACENVDFYRRINKLTKKLLMIFLNVNVGGYSCDFICTHIGLRYYVTESD